MRNIDQGNVVDMQFDAINARLEDIRNNTEDIGRFVEEYKPFIASCAGKAAGRYMSYGTDDELSIAMMAFVEAINSFDNTKGNFFTFSRNVIKRRLIDYYRSEKRHSNVISLNLYMEERDEEYDLSSDEAVRNYSDQRLTELRRLELQELGKELEQWNITYRDLARVSPKHRKTRQQCAELAGLILSRPDILQLVMAKKYLPVAELERISGLPRKLIERFRKYIIAIVVIAIGDYEYIKDYIKL
jgi:RNA polymerase sigma factor